VIEASWDGDGIRLRGAPPGTEVEVRPVADILGLPPTAGRVSAGGDGLRFVPRFGFVDGTAYVVRAGGVVVATLTRPRPERPAATEVVEIYPTADEVPRNLLRCYVRFSAPMGRGYVGGNVRLVDEAGETIEGALLPADHELWDADRVRLTVLLDPGRIKRGVADGPSLGAAFRLVIGPDFLDAQGLPLRSGADRRYRVGADERRRIDPSGFALTAPASESQDPLVVGFDRPLDHALLTRCLHVTGPDGPVDGSVSVDVGERTWRLTPSRPWTAGRHDLVVDPVLEDLAGNSVVRVFDRDLSRPEDAPGPAEPVVVAFHPN
jgi:hypothetical protein